MTKFTRLKLIATTLLCIAIFPADARQGKDYEKIAKTALEAAKNDPEFKDEIPQLRVTLPKYLRYLDKPTDGKLRRMEEETAKAFYEKYIGNNRGSRKPFSSPAKEIQRSTTFRVRKATKYNAIEAVIGSSKRSESELFRLYSDRKDDRSQTIVRRFQKLNKSATGWWSTLRPKRMKAENGSYEWVVSSPLLTGKDKGVLVTADTEFARRSAKDQRGLAESLSRMIILAFDPQRGGSFRADEPPTADERRFKALNLEGQADALDNSQAAKAEDLYRQAIAADPSYGNAYVSLASHLTEVGRKDEAISLLKAALESGVLNEIAADLVREKLRELED